MFLWDSLKFSNFTFSHCWDSSKFSKMVCFKQLINFKLVQVSQNNIHFLTMVKIYNNGTWYYDTSHNLEIYILLNKMNMYSVETLSQEAYIFTNILHKIIIKKFKFIKNWNVFTHICWFSFLFDNFVHVQNCICIYNLKK